jgi:hypothetical protein
MASIQQSIQINAAAHAVYQQLTRFEDYPQFMEDVQAVQKTDDTHLHWITRMANRPVEWDAEITEQRSDRCIAWHNISGPTNAGKVEVQEIGPDSSQVMFTLDSGAEQVPGSMAGYTEADLEQRLKLDLTRLKDMMESQGGAMQTMPQQMPMRSDGSPQTSAGGNAAAPLPMRHLGDMPQDTASEQHGGVPTSDPAGKPSYPAFRDSMGGVYEIHDAPATQASAPAATPGNSSLAANASPPDKPAPAGMSATIGAAGGTDASAGAQLSGSKGGPGGPSPREEAGASSAPGTPGGELEGERISPGAGADAAGGTGLGTAASADDTRTGGGMSGARDAGTSGKGGSS